MKKESARDDGVAAIRGHLRQYPQRLLKALMQIEQHCGRLYLTGGTVRDGLLGRASADLDLTVQAGARTCCRLLLAELGSGALVPLGDESDDACRVVWKRLTIDVTGFRGGSQRIEDDLLRRDFTINALAVSLADCLDTPGEGPLLIDPAAGRADLAAGRLRACTNAFTDDPLRILRGCRLAAVLGFTLDAATRTQMAAHAPLLAAVAVERVSHELDLIMESERAAATMADMADSGILWHIVPELQRGLGVQQPGYHHLDVLHHSLAALGCMEEILRRPERYYPGSGEVFAGFIREHAARRLLKWAALLHDVGKPLVMDVRPAKEGRTTFYNHDRVGSLVFLEIAGRLRWSNEARDTVGRLIELHMHPFHLCNVRRRGGLTRRASLKICKKADRHLPGLFLLAMADSLASLGEKKPPGMEDELAALFAELLKIIAETIKPVLAGPRLVTGRDLIERFGLPPGPLFSTLLAGLELAMVEGRVRNREEALDWVDHYLHQRGKGEDVP